MKKLVFGIFFFLSCNLHAQSALSYEGLLTENDMKSILSYLADDNARGRASGTDGKQYAERFIRDKFIEYGLRPYNWSYTQSFRYNDSIAIRNVVGIIPSNRITDEYIIVCAHYDHLGEIHGKIYNGADDNASGVTAMLGIAKLFSYMRKEGKGPSKNIIFAALDGKELSLAGSEYFANHLLMPAEKISCVVNMDIIGTTLVPPGSNSDYLIVLGNESLPEEKQHIIEGCNKLGRFRMDVQYTFYGSKEFTRIMLSNGDHTPFARKGIPALFFTSGFHQYTYKTTDDVEIIDFKTLRKRTLLIFNIITRI